MSINSVNNVSAASTTGAGATGVASPTVDYNEFLHLLVAELQNQDPTKPADPTQYMSQLASFSAVEQQVQTNSTLDSLLAAQAGALVGHTVTSADGATSGIVASIQVKAGGGATATLQSGEAVALVSGVTIAS